MRESIGNIRENSVQEIWKGERAEKLRKSIHDKECFCTHGCFQPLNILYNKSSYTKVLRYMFNNPLLDVHEVAEDKIETTQFKGMVNIGDETPKFWSSDALKIKKG